MEDDSNYDAPNWVPEEFTIYLEILGRLNGTEWKIGELEKVLSGIDRVLAQKVLEYGREKGIIEVDTMRLKYIIRLEYAFGDVESNEDYFH